METLRLSWQGNPAVVPPDRPPGPVDVIIPVSGAADAFRRCAESVVRHTDLVRNRLVVVLDGPQPPVTEELVARLERELEAGGILVASNVERRGFVVSVNRGMEASNRDVVLLNSDTQVTAGWIDKLQAAAYSAPEVATATPFSNNATICSLPRTLEDNAIPAGWDVDSFGRLVETTSKRAYQRLPTGVGSCIYLKRKALEQLGLFDHKRFGHGYGEESEWCMRALKAGYTHVLDDATFIFHEGQRSFGASRDRRMEAERQVMLGLHPEYPVTVQAFIREDPIRPLRERVLAELQPPRGPERPPARVLHVVHGWPPWGAAASERYVAALARCQARVRDVTVYARIVDSARSPGNATELLDAGVRVRMVINNVMERDPLVRTAVHDPSRDAEFERFLRDLQPSLLHVHHLAGHTMSLLAVAARCRVPVVFQVHDWWILCADERLASVERRRCALSSPAEGVAAPPLPRDRPAWLPSRLLHASQGKEFRRLLDHVDAFLFESDRLHRTYAERGALPADVPVYLAPFADEPTPESIGDHAQAIEEIYGFVTARHRRLAQVFEAGAAEE